MSSINPHFTFNYSQPEDYRFSHDSVFLARRVFELYRNVPLENLHGLDLCSGCGVIGLDFLFHCNNETQKSFRKFDFLEVQNVYAEHFSINVERLGFIPTELKFLNQNYADLLSKNFADTYDLILCNPPYFHQGQGKLSPSEFKNRCRFFLDSDFKSLLLGIAHALKPEGQAYVLLRDQKEHGWNSFEEARKILSDMHLEKLEDIRGTDLVKITKAPRKT
ncbi:methyltransferase [Bdellovibrio bacteriovorus]|uniref:methyltransferase n=1 Tax=Bdellovibrio TaxID=958 RepID=UPI0035A8B8BF